MASIKGRNFAFIVYPEHFPNLTVSEIGSKFAKALMQPLAVSPLHTMSDEEQIKPHLHMLTCISGAKTDAQIYAALLSNSLAESLAGYKECASPEQIHNMVQLVGNKETYLRYLIHFDNPEKEQFNGIGSILLYNGFDIGNAFKISKVESYQMMFEILQYVERNQVGFFCDLITYCMYNRYDDWFIYLSEHGALVREYMRSKVAKSNFDLKCLEIETIRESELIKK